MTAVEELRAAYDAVRADIVEHLDCPPELARDADGRYILLEALTALVIAESGVSVAAALAPDQTLVVGLPECVTRQEVDNLRTLVDAQSPGFKVFFIAGATHFAVAEGS